MLKQEKSDSTAADDFRSLAEAAPPCITITLPLPEPMGVRTRLKNALREAEKGLKESGAGAEQAELLLQPMKELAAPIGPDRNPTLMQPVSHQPSGVPGLCAWSPSRPKFTIPRGWRFPLSIFAETRSDRLLFGIWPANRAARLDPVVALRYERQIST